MASKLKKAEEVDDLVVGKYYMVAHARIIVYPGKKEELVPIIPILHNDPQFGGAGKYKHYHFDTRFNFHSSYFSVISGRTNSVIIETWPDSSLKFYEFQDIVYLRRKCKTLITGLHLESVLSPDPSIKNWVNWYKGFVGKKCKGRKCPHYGATMQDKGSHYVCPLHNLIADKKSNKIVDYKGLPSLLRN